MADLVAFAQCADESKIRNAHKVRFASSNKPELVVVVESPVSEARMREMFKSVDAVLRTHKEVGEYNQTI
jgi:hypothetical protein